MLPAGALKIQPMKIIAFDLGRHMGWAHNASDRLEYGHWDIEGERPVRLRMIMGEVKFALRFYRFDLVVYETPFARGLHATRSLWGTAGVIEAIATQMGVPVVDVSVATIKKFATGDGHAPKNMMVWAAKGFGYVGDNEHEADAVCLLRYAEENVEKVA